MDLVVFGCCKHFVSSLVSNYKGDTICVSFHRRSKLESDQFPYISLSVNTSSKVSLILGYEGCLNLRFLNVFKSTG